MIIEEGGCKKFSGPYRSPPCYLTHICSVNSLQSVVIHRPLCYCRYYLGFLACRKAAWTLGGKKRLVINPDRPDTTECVSVHIGTITQPELWWTEKGFGTRFFLSFSSILVGFNSSKASLSRLVYFESTPCSLNTVSRNMKNNNGRMDQIKLSQNGGNLWHYIMTVMWLNEKTGGLTVDASSQECLFFQLPNEEKKRSLRRSNRSWV